MSNDVGSDVAYPEEAASIPDKPKAEFTKSESPVGAQAGPEGFQYVFSKRFFSNGKVKCFFSLICMATKSV